MVSVERQGWRGGEKQIRSDLDEIDTFLEATQLSADCLPGRRPLAPHLPPTFATLSTAPI